MKMARKIVFSNRKGGVGKTTSAVNVAAGLCLQGQRVLLVDVDSQAHASLALGVRPPGEVDLLAFISGDSKACLSVRPGLFLVPASSRLSRYEAEALRRPRELLRLREALAEKDRDFDFIIIDSPPNPGVLTLSALLAAEEVIAPMPLHFLALKGLAETQALIEKVRRNNPRLHLAGVLPTFFSPQLRHVRAVKQEIQKVFGERILLPPIRNSVRLAEAPSFGQTIFEYAPESPVADDYRRVVMAILEAKNVPEERVAGNIA